MKYRWLYACGFAETAAASPIPNGPSMGTVPAQPARATLMALRLAKKRAARGDGNIGSSNFPVRPGHCLRPAQASIARSAAV